MTTNFVKLIIERGGKIVPIIVPYELSKGTGQMNPSLLIDGERFLINLRGIQYVLVHSENKQRWQSRWGPLTYVHPENDQTLRTTNFFMEFDKDLKCKRINKVDTSKLDTPSQWTFIGLEDVRLVKWNDKYYMCGVRRDDNPTGKGRIEISETEINNDNVSEVARWKIEPPVDSYCEKNWMPVQELPFHFVKWTNPTELIVADLTSKQATQVFPPREPLPGYRDFRGGSSVITWGDKYLALVHETLLFNNELGNKDAYYYHRFIVWDKDFNLIKLSDCFNFMTARIEFCCGLGIMNDKAYITFGFQDNAAYLLQLPLNYMEEFIYEQ